MSAASKKVHGNKMSSGRHIRRPKALIMALAISGLLCGYATEACAELTASSNEPAPAADQNTLANGFNAAVTEARTLDFVSNYAALYQANPQWDTDTSNGSSTLACPNPNTNPVISPGYLAGLSNRCAYYSRDYVHYATGAYFLGYYEQNYQMADHFATLSHVNDGANAPYWAIGVTGTAYEQNDESPSPFELGENIANMYRLTADSRYLGTDFTNYISQMTSFANVGNGGSINSDGFRMARTQDGEAATYNEFVGNAGVPSNTEIVLGGDMAAAEIAYYRAISQYPALATSNAASTYNTLLSNFNAHWYLPNSATSTLPAHFSAALTGHAGVAYSRLSVPNYSSLTYFDDYAEEPNLFPLYKGIITNPTQLQNQATYVDSNAEAMYQAANKSLASPGVESHTYLPTAFYNAGMPSTAWKWLTRLSAWQVNGGTTAYPEVSFALISDTITKVLGVNYNAPNSILSTLSGLPPSFTTGNYVTVSNIPIYNSQLNTGIYINVTQKAPNASGLPETDMAFASDLAQVPYNQGFHWAPGFVNVGANQHCQITSTFTNGSQRVDIDSLVTNSTTGVSTCVDVSGVGIWVFTGAPSYDVNSMAVTLAP